MSGSSLPSGRTVTSESSSLALSSPPPDMLSRMCSSGETSPSSAAFISDARATEAAGSGLAFSIDVQSFSAESASAFVTSRNLPLQAAIAS